MAILLVREPPPFIDIHCHMVPGIDDGARDWDETLSMARMAVADGFSTTIVTPHQLGSFSQNDGETVRQQAQVLRQFLRDQNVPLKILPGADVRIEADLVARVRRGDVVTLGDRRRHVLLELPHELYVPLGPLLGKLRAAGMVGILSHPERNAELLTSLRLVESLVEEESCLMQVTAGSLLGAFGSKTQQFSQDIIEQGLVHFLATDAHGSRARRPLMRRAFLRVVELTDWENAVALCCENPLRVSRGHDVSGGRRYEKPRGPTRWFRRRRAG